MSDKMSELLPCPFCGRQEAKTEFGRGPHLDRSRMGEFMVICLSCCATAFTNDEQKAVEKWNTRTVPPAAQPAGSPNQVPVLRRGNKTFTEVEAVEVIRDTINDWESCDLKIKAQWLLEFYDAHAAHPAPPAAGGPQTCVLCGHEDWRNSEGRCGALEQDGCNEGDVSRCLCKCEFPAATTSAIEAAREIHEWSKGSGLVDGGAINEVAAVITKHLNDSARPAQELPNEELRSKCCDAPTRTANTDYNVCTSCREACEVTVAASSSERERKDG